LHHRPQRLPAAQSRHLELRAKHRLRIPAKPGHHSDASEAIIPVDGGPVVKRWVDCRRYR